VITGKLSKEKKKFKNLSETVKFVAKIAEDKKAGYIKIIEVGPRLVITDYFILVSVSNTRLASSIADEIGQSLKKYGLYPLNINGKNEGNWILMDYDEFIVHIFTDEYMQYYDLERLWRDAKVLLPRAGKKKEKTTDKKAENSAADNQPGQEDTV
jgi:ribosome-associated protein